MLIRFYLDWLLGSRIGGSVVDIINNQNFSAVSAIKKIHYKVSLDTMAKIITGVIVAMTVGFLMAGFYAATSEVGESDLKEGFPFFLPAGIMLLVILFCYGFRITGYELDDESLRICRPVSSLLIGFAEIKEVSVASESVMGRTYRLFGNGGVFGYFGLFRNAAFGNMYWYATRNSNWIILEASGNRKLVITPDDPGMAEAIRRKIKTE